MTGITITVTGTPAPQGSKRHVGKGVMIESSRAVGPWREAVKAAAIASGTDMMRQPVELHIVFYLRRPKHHYGTGRNAGALTMTAPAHPRTRPDLDKLLRSTLDGLTGVLYRDDAQVVKVVAEKLYAARWRSPGAAITIREAVREATQ